jgi:outer membrane putative beta-barrel porin/alpha-amylase
MRRIPLFTILLLFILITSEISAQCCAAGNPISDDGSPGGDGKYKFEAGIFGSYSYSDIYFEGNKKSDYEYIDYSYFIYSSVNVSYGITDKLKFLAEIGYFFAKSQYFVFDQNRNATGLGDLVIGGQYLAYRNNEKQFNVFPRFKLTIPVGEFDQIDGSVVLPIDIQPSSGSYKYHFGLLFSKLYMGGNLAMFFDNSFEISQRIVTDRTNYKYGNLLNNSLYAGYKFAHNFTFALQLRSQYRNKASNKNKELINATGGHVLFLSPQLRYNFLKTWNITVKYDYPFYKNMNGTQLTNNYVFSLKLSKSLDFSRN